MRQTQTKLVSLNFGRLGTLIYEGLLLLVGAAFLSLVEAGVFNLCGFKELVPMVFIIGNVWFLVLLSLLVLDTWRSDPFGGGPFKMRVILSKAVIVIGFVVVLLVVFLPAALIEGAVKPVTYRPLNPVKNRRKAAQEKAP